MTYIRPLKSSAKTSFAEYLGRSINSGSLSQNRISGNTVRASGTILKDWNASLDLNTATLGKYCLTFCLTDPRGSPHSGPRITSAS